MEGRTENVEYGTIDWQKKYNKQNAGKKEMDKMRIHQLAGCSRRPRRRRRRRRTPR